MANTIQTIREHQRLHYGNGMGWLRLVGSLKLQVSFAESCLFYRALLQRRPLILRSLLIEVTPKGWVSLRSVYERAILCGETAILKTLISSVLRTLSKRDAHIMHHVVKWATHMREKRKNRATHIREKRGPYYKHPYDTWYRWVNGLRETHRLETPIFLELRLREIPILETPSFLELCLRETSI